MNDIAYVVESKGSANVAAIGLLSDTWNINLDNSGLFIPVARRYGRWPDRNVWPGGV
jgi:hypothetical protein